MKWMIIAIATVLVAAWMFRWTMTGPGTFLDRWTGDLVNCRETEEDVGLAGYKLKVAECRAHGNLNY